jgi:enamine deaminase RidA (YjgF/YER057c/UK114 family)
MPLAAMLRLAIVPASQLARPPHDVPGHLLGGACFAQPTHALDTGPLPLLTVDMPVLSENEPVCEVWYCTEPLQSGQQGRIRYQQSDSLLFGCIDLEEIDGDAHPPLQFTAEAAYQAIFELLEARGYSAVLRFWNYFPAINQESHQIERYRQFNCGRQDAFLAHGRSVIGNVPAACALGSASGGLQIAFLATRAQVIGIENPRQLSAYHYPSQYGPRSPTFSRAGLVKLGGRDMLFISGTASIVGHQTLHEGDVVAQTHECLHNIAAVVAEANRQAPDAHFQLDQLAYKIYVRNPDDLCIVRREVTRVIGAPASAIFLQADVCRADLLVEIEASGGHSISVATHP